MEQLDFIRDAHCGDQAIDCLAHRQPFPTTGPIDARALLKDREHVHAEDGIREQDGSCSIIDRVIPNAL